MYKSKETGGRGFRDFRSIDLALLSKQAWRISFKPSSNLGQVIRAKNGAANPGELLLHYRPPAFRGMFEAYTVVKPLIQMYVSLGLVRRVGDLSGVYSVKSAYQSISNSLATENLASSGSSSTMHLKKFWQRVWKLKLPSKISIFCWKAYNNGIPLCLSTC